MTGGPSRAESRSESEDVTSVFVVGYSAETYLEETVKVGWDTSNSLATLD